MKDFPSLSKKSDPEPHRVVVTSHMWGEGAFHLERDYLGLISDVESVAFELDLSTVDKIDSRGIAFCASVVRECEKKNATLSILASRSVYHMLQLVRFDLVAQLTCASHSQ